VKQRYFFIFKKQIVFQILLNKIFCINNFAAKNRTNTIDLPLPLRLKIKDL